MPIDVRLFAVSPDGSQLLTFTPDARLRLWDLSTGEVLAESEHYQVEDSYPSLNANGTMLTIPGIPQVEVIRLETGETTEIGDYADASRIRVEMVGNNRLAVEVMTAGWEVVLDIWDLEENKIVRTFKNYYGCSFNETGSHMVCNSNLQLFEVESGRLLGSYGPPGPRYEWALSSDGKQIALCSYVVEEGWVTLRSDNISIYDTSKNELRRLLTTDEKGICSRMAFSPDGQYLVNSKGYVWSTRTASVVSKFESPSEYVTVSVDPSSQMILAGNVLFDLANGDQIGRLDSGYGRNPPAFIMDGQFIAAVSDDQVGFWGSNLQQGDSPDDCRGDTYALECFEFIFAKTQPLGGVSNIYDIASGQIIGEDVFVYKPKQDAYTASVMIAGSPFDFSGKAEISIDPRNNLDALHLLSGTPEEIEEFLFLDPNFEYLLMQLPNEELRLELVDIAHVD